MKQLNSLISTIKSKLKRGKPEDDEEEYEDEEEDEGTDVGEKTEASEVTSKKAAKPKAKSKSKDEDEEEDEEEEDEDEEDEDGESDDEAKKKKRVKIMGAIFAVVLLYVVADEMFLKTDVEENAVPEVTGGFKRPPKRDRTKAKSKATPATESAIAAAKDATPTPAPAATEAAPVEDKLETPAIDEASEQVAEVATPTPAPTVQEEEAMAPNPFLETPTPAVGESTPTELEIPDRSEENLPVAEAAKIDEMIAGEVKKEYVAPPKYDQIGRGLVYNCGGKHWACVDKAAYFQCKDNYLHNNSEQKTIECYPSEVYATYDDCKTVQIHHINMVKEIDFCTAN